MERVVLSFGVGAACLSTAVFALCAVGMARTPWLVVAALAVCAGATVAGRSASFEPVDRRWAWFCGLVCTPFALLYLANAAAPEISPDGAGYHLGLVRRYFNHGGFYRIATNMMANLTQGGEMLYLAAYSIGRHSAAALTHFAFLLALPAALIAYGRRFGLQTAGAIAAVLVFVAPVAGVAGTSAYVDVALGFSGFATFYLLEIWNERREDTRLLFAAGAMAGFCFAIKYTGFIAVVAAAVYVIWAGRRIKWLAVMAAAAALVGCPWLVKNWILVDNPVSPFFNRIFPNRYVHVSMEEQYLQSMRHYGGARITLSTPLDLAVHGGVLQGTLGPVFLLAPLALGALRRRRGGRVVAAAGLMALPWLINLGTRFLIPALPFLALAMGMALADWPKMGMALAAFNAVLCWPPILALYCDAGTWRLSRFPWEAALRMIPAEEWVEQNAPEVRFARMIQKHVPEDGAVYTAQPVMEAYTDRTILLDYEAALNNRVADLLRVAANPPSQPVRRIAWRFEPREISGFRITATGPANEWAIHEIEEPAAAKVTASVSPWYAEMAADGQLVTSWRAWQPVKAGAFIEVETGGMVRTGSVVFRTRRNEPGPRLRLELRSGDGTWASVKAEMSVDDSAACGDLRGSATGAIRREGITHLLIHDQEALGTDFRTCAAQWKVRQQAVSPPVRLYQILAAGSIDTPRKLRNNTR